MHASFPDFSLSFFRGKQDDTYGADGLQGFTRDGQTEEYDADAAEVDDAIINDEEDDERRSEEPEDGESLDDRLDE